MLCVNAKLFGIGIVSALSAETSYRWILCTIIISLLAALVSLVACLASCLSISEAGLKLVSKFNHVITRVVRTEWNNRHNNSLEDKHEDAHFLPSRIHEHLSYAAVSSLCGRNL